MAEKNEEGFKVPEECFYTKSHEWVRVEDGTAVVGITDWAQSQLGDITYVELPEEGDSFKREKVFGSVDSLKTSSELYAPIDGDIVELNTELNDSPELINEDPYSQGWIIKLEISDEKQLEELLNAEAYLKLISKEAKKSKKAG